MYAIIRKIEIVGIIDESCDVYNICRRLQSSICRSNKQILETDIFDDNKSDEVVVIDTNNKTDATNGSVSRIFLKIIRSQFDVRNP